MINVSTTKLSDSPYSDLLDAVGEAVKKDGADNLKQAIAIIDHTNTEDFEQPQKDTLAKVKGIITTLLKGLTEGKMHYRRRRALLESVRVLTTVEKSRD